MFCFVPVVNPLPASSDSCYLYIALKEFIDNCVTEVVRFGLGFGHGLHFLGAVDH